ncbi:substrate-binding periplasmic protein [Halarcobacter mediterraneus]|uniref:substrate-binding periplasmic protein n=1 Tax=Halarcobacter mediterraneus TaxID=2023153 RepID=UPI0013E9417B|nr:ABC transporter substrate-binding protein [Halarcobacter mediterraneus]
MKNIIFLFTCFLFVLNADEIQPLTESWEPYQIETKDGLEGIGIDLIKEIQKRVGNKKEIKVFPWKRSYNITLNKKGYALFLTTKSKHRENFFKWVGPVNSMKIKFFKNASRKDLSINSIEDAKKVSSIIVAENTISEETLRELGFKNLEINTISNGSFYKLLENKVDLYPVEYDSFIYKLKKMKLEDKIIPVKMKEPIIKSQLYIAFNKKTDDKIIKKWQKALDDIKNDGTYKRILERYGKSEETSFK